MQVNDVSIMVLCWNTCSDTRLCVQAIQRERKHLSAVGLASKLIVIDNGSIDDTPQMLKKDFGKSIDKLILNKENLGISLGRNLGIDSAEGDYLYMVDGDISAVKGSFRAMHAYMEAHPHVGNLGAFSWQVTQDYDKQTPFLERVTQITEHWASTPDYPTAMTQYGIFRRSIFDAGLRFDTAPIFTGCGWGYEDNDLAMQMWQAGFLIRVFSDVTYYHRIESSKRVMERLGLKNNVADRLKYLRAKWGNKPYFQK